NFVSVKGAGGNGDTFGADDCQSFELRLLLLHIKVAEGCAVVRSQGQTPNHIERAAAVRENNSADVNHDRFRLAVLRHRSTRFIVFEVEFNYHIALTDRTMLKREAAFLDR